MQDDKNNTAVELAADNKGADESGPPSTDAIETSSTATLQFSQSTYPVNKGEAASALITVTRTGPAENEASVSYATEGDDNGYDPTSGVLTFKEGETLKTFAVPVTEGHSQCVTAVDLNLSNPQGAVLGDPTTASVSFMPPDAYAAFQRWGWLWRMLDGSAKSSWIKHIGLVILLIALFYVLASFIVRKGESHSIEWSEHLQPQAAQLAFMDGFFVFSSQEKDRLNTQLKTIRERMKLHLRVMGFYYTRYYMAIITSSLAAALAAVAIILISKSGWQQTSGYVITMFFVAAAASVFYGAFPGVFQQQQNITDNKQLYLKYAALENEVLSYAVTQEALKYDVTASELKRAAETQGTDESKPSTTPKNKSAQSSGPSDKARADDSTTGIPLSPSNFIHYVDQQLAQDNIAIGFDYGQIPNYKTAFSTK